MSKESAKKFMEDLSNKPELMKEAKKHLEKIHDKDDRMKYLCDFANARGYNFSPEEIKLFMKSFKDSLSDEELDNVAGGVGDWRTLKGAAQTVAKDVLNFLFE